MTRIRKSSSSVNSCNAGKRDTEALTALASTKNTMSIAPGKGFLKQVFNVLKDIIAVSKV